MTSTGPQLSRVDGELGPAWLGLGLGVELIWGLRERKAKALATADAAHPLCCAFLLPALSLFLTSSGSRAARQRDPCHTPGHTPATGEAQGWAARATKRAGTATADSWASAGHSCFCKALLGKN